MQNLSKACACSTHRCRCEGGTLRPRHIAPDTKASPPTQPPLPKAKPRKSPPDVFDDFLSSAIRNIANIERKLDFLNETIVFTTSASTIQLLVYEAEKAVSKHLSQLLEQLTGFFDRMYESMHVYMGMKACLDACGGLRKACGELSTLEPSRGTCCDSLTEKLGAVRGRLELASKVASMREAVELLRDVELVKWV